jgi:outer membrane protein
MKNLPLILSALALIGVGFLAFKGNGKNTKATTTQIDSSGKKVEIELSRIAYVDLDTLESKYKLFGRKKAEFESREKKIERELASKAKALEASYVSLQKKAQAGSLTQAEGEKLQKSLIKRQENLEKLRNNQASKLMKDQDTFNKQLKKKLDEVVSEFNKDNKYDYILSYSKDGSIIHVNTSLDITQEIVDRMNASE